MTKYCPKCGEQLVDTAKFCKNCGANLEDMTNPEPSTKDFQVPTVEKDHTAAIIIGYILAIILPLLGLIMSIYLLTRESEKAKKHGKYVLIVTIVIWVLSFISIYH